MQGHSAARNRLYDNSFSAKSVHCPRWRRTIDAVAVQFEASIIKNEIYSSTSLIAEDFDSVPKTVEMVAEDVLFSSGKVVATGGLERLDLFLGHINQERKVGRVAPEAYWVSRKLGGDEP